MTSRAEQSFDLRLKSATSSALPHLRSRFLNGQAFITRTELCKWLEVTDWQLQKLIHDGHLPKTRKIQGSKSFDLFLALKSLYEWTGDEVEVQGELPVEL